MQNTFVFYFSRDLYLQEVHWNATINIVKLSIEDFQIDTLFYVVVENLEISHSFLM